jgi:hypothetical protein
MCEVSCEKGYRARKTVMRPPCALGYPFVRAATRRVGSGLSKAAVSDGAHEEGEPDEWIPEEEEHVPYLRSPFFACGSRALADFVRFTSWWQMALDGEVLAPVHPQVTVAPSSETAPKLPDL